MERGNTDVFTSYDGFPSDLTAEDDTIAWTQAEFLRAASAVSQTIWHEPLHLKSWRVLVVFFDGDCHEDFRGFFAFQITYFKPVRIGPTVTYVARHIELTPWNGLAYWAGDGEFSTPWIFAWRSVWIAGAKIPAEQAARIAGENGAYRV